MRLKITPVSAILQICRVSLSASLDCEQHRKYPNSLIAHKELLEPTGNADPKSEHSDHVNGDWNLQHTLIS